MSHTSEFVDQDEAEHGFRRNVAELDFDCLDCAVLVVVEDGDLSMNSVGSPEMVAAALRQALAELERIFVPPMN